MTRTPLWKRLHLFLVALLAIGLVGCDDDDGPTGPGTSEPTQNIVELASATESLSTLTAAVTTAGLADDLQGDGPFTVFAPTNAAFEALNVEAALSEENRALLTSILTTHVVAGEAFQRTDFIGGRTLTTLSGETVDVSSEGGFTVNGITFSSTTVEATNGIVHVIDGVILPPVSLTQRAALTAATSTLNAALEAAELTDALSGQGPFTVFAPANSAFAALDPETINNLLDPDNESILSNVLTYHVVPGRILSSDLQDGQTPATLQGDTVSIGVDGGAVTVNKANVIAADIEVTNGVIHLIDDVLFESLNVLERAVVTEATATLATAAQAAELTGALGGEAPITVFAPVNSAFANLSTDQLNNLLDPRNKDLLAKVLTYHVVPGRVLSTDLQDGQTAETLQGSNVSIGVTANGVTVDNANVIAADIEVANGVIHLIDSVIAPPFDLVETAAFLGFSTLQTAIIEANLATALQAPEGPFTVFAPTNAAFADLPDGVLDDLLQNPSELAEILQYHVVSGEVPSSALSDGQIVQTLQGDDISFTIANDQISVNGALVGPADVQTTNGIIHVIDTVLLPPSE